MYCLCAINTHILAVTVFKVRDYLLPPPPINDDHIRCAICVSNNCVMVPLPFNNNYVRRVICDLIFQQWWHGHNHEFVYGFLWWKKCANLQKHFCDLAQETIVLLSQCNMMLGMNAYAAAIYPPCYPVHRVHVWLNILTLLVSSCMLLKTKMNKHVYLQDFPTHGV